jgi:hypothetical protein
MNRRKEMPRFYGLFNFQGDTHNLTTTAKTEDQAYHRMLSGLSKKLSLSRRALLYHFNGERDNYHITEEEPRNELRKGNV